MAIVKHKIWPIALCVVSIQLSGATHPSKRMPGGKQWTTQNLNVKTALSYCYQDKDAKCLQYGRLYTWDAARRACESLGAGWRLPTNEEWRQMAEQYGGLLEESDAGGKATFQALIVGGSAGFNAVLGGGRSVDGEFARLDAHGFYWTASESNAATAWFYNFGKGMSALNRHSDGEKQRAFSVRCIKE